MEICEIGFRQHPVVVQPPATTACEQPKPKAFAVVYPTLDDFLGFLLKRLKNFEKNAIPLFLWKCRAYMIDQQAYISEGHGAELVLHSARRKIQQEMQR